MTEPKDDKSLESAQLRHLLEALEESGSMPPPGLKARILERVRQDSHSDFTVVRAGEGGWLTIAPGVTAKILNDDGRVRTWLARMERGAVVAAHHHPLDEECLVLKGTLRSGSTHVGEGDYQLARAGSWHDELTTDTGCLLFLRSASAA